jgi:hypothetical protein
LATLTGFLDAYNKGGSTEALALASDNVSGNDCDYKTSEMIQFSGKAEMKTWLEARIADHDRLTVSEVYNLSGSPNVVGVVWARRSSDYLSAHGFPDGVVPKGAAKIQLDGRSEHIAGFINAGSRNPAPECIPA